MAHISFATASYKVEVRNQDTGYWELAHSCPMSPKLSTDDASLNARIRAIHLAKTAYEPTRVTLNLFAGFKQKVIRKPVIDVRVVATAGLVNEVIWQNGQFLD